MKDANCVEDATRAIVNNGNESKTNPFLLNDWENVNEIVLNTSGNHKVSAPWATGTSSSLDVDFRKDIKKEDGWVMAISYIQKERLRRETKLYVFL